MRRNERSQLHHVDPGLQDRARKTHQHRLITAFTPGDITVLNVQRPAELTPLSSRKIDVVTALSIPTLQHTPVDTLHRQNQLQLNAEQIAVEQQITQQLSHQLWLQRNPSTHTTR